MNKILTSLETHKWSSQKEPIIFKSTELQWTQNNPHDGIEAGS